MLIPEFLQEKEHDGDEHCHGADDAGDEHDEQVPVIGEAFGLPAVLGGLSFVHLAYLGPEDFDFGPENFDFGINVFLHPLPQCLVGGCDNILNLFVFCHVQFRECGSSAKKAGQQQKDSEMFHEIFLFLLVIFNYTTFLGFLSRVYFFLHRGLREENRQIWKSVLTNQRAETEKAMALEAARFSSPHLFSTGSRSGDLDLRGWEVAAFSFRKPKPRTKWLWGNCRLTKNR